MSLLTSNAKYARRCSGCKSFIPKDLTQNEANGPNQTGTALFPRGVCDE